MAQKYVQLMEDLQYARREMQTWKQRASIAQQQLQTIIKQKQQLKKAMDTMQQSNSKLVRSNRYLSEQKQSIVSDLSTEMSTIKQEIAQKQRQINSLREIVAPTHINQELSIRQIRFELTEKFEVEGAGKDRRIQELTALNEKVNYQRLIQKEKMGLKIQGLQKELKALISKHETQIQQYSNKLFKLTQPNPPQQKQLLRRAKKQSQQWKKRLQLANTDLALTMQQKTKIHKDYSSWMKQHQKQINVHQNEIMTYKEEIARLNDLVERIENKKDDYVIKERERDIRKLRGELEEMRDQVVSKGKKISDLEVETNRLQGQLKMSKQQQDKVVARVEQADHWQIQRLKHQLTQTRNSLQKFRAQNFQLNDRILQVNHNTVTNKKKFQQLSYQQQEVKNKLKRKLSEQMLNINSYQQNKQRVVNNNQEDNKKLEDALRNQKGKMRDFLVKYIQSKKKEDVMEKKLKKANQKIMELLREKIMVNSPKATVKHFQFPTETQTRISPPKIQYRHPHPQVRQVSPSPNAREDILINSSEGQHFVTTADFKPFRPDPHSKTNPAFNRQFLSPQDHRHIRIQDESVQSGNDKSYYQKSLKMKSKKFRELRCTNHEPQCHS